MQQQDFDIDLPRSWMIGDKQLDVELGQRAGLATAMVLTGYGESHKKEFDVQPTIVSENLSVAVQEILERSRNVELDSSKIVLKPLDIVLTEVIARLGLNKQQFLGRVLIFHTIRRLDRDINHSAGMH